MCAHSSTLDTRRVFHKQEISESFIIHHTIDIKLREENEPMQRKSVLLLSILPFIAMISAAVNVGVVGASGVAVSIDPLATWDPALGIGTQFSIDIVVDYVENLWGYQFWLSFDNTTLHGVSVENGPFLASAGGIVIVAPGAGFDNEAGELKLFGAAIFFMGPPPSDAILPDGGGVLATVTFEVVGIGCSPIMLGPETGLRNKWNEWEFQGEHTYGWITVYPPGQPPYDEPYWPWRESLGHGFFSNVAEGPELYVRRRGAHGVTGIWPEWQVGDVDSTQTLYCEVFNYGFMGADVSVSFVIHNDVVGLEIMSDAEWLDPAIDKGVPSSVTVSVSFKPGITGKYYVCAILYFQTGCMLKAAPYCQCEDALGGEGLSRDISVGFKVQ